MSRWQLITLSVLSLLPVLLLAGFGGWSLYQSGYWLWLWWTMPLCWGIASLLWRRWGQVDLPQPPLDRTHWTPQDQTATAIVEAEQRRVGEYTTQQLCDPQFYTQVTQALALKIAQHYYPKANDPLGQRTVVEILAAVQLISADVEDWFLRYVPGGHLVTVSHWKLLSHAPGWLQTASNAGWVASIFMNPLNLGRFLASKLTMYPLSGQVQQNLLGLFYAAYIRQAGYYLIELNSGRLQGGSERYRRWMKQVQTPTPLTPPGSVPTATEPPPEPVTITIALIGQVKAGKSSLVNALVNRSAAVTDVLPATKQVHRYAYTPPGHGDRFILLDTTGYSDAGATSEQQAETREAVRQADLVLLVLDARSPSRDADVKTLAGLAEWYSFNPRLKPPPLLVVLNKIDGLSPVMDWAPPYDWRNPVRPKEKNIAAAVAYAHEVFGAKIKGVIPTCCDAEHERVFGIGTDLVPAMAEQLDQARSAALLRELRRSIDQGKFSQVAGQVWEIGKKLKGIVAEWPQ